ncbi:MAG TPA: PH domain-containing protein, partial [Flavisolibacter sp.]|nr:PH domain-containing protein [Flavisolibacter sp.]
MKQMDWSKPQRQPLAGLLIIFANTFWEVLKRMWPFLLLPILRANPEKPGRYEIIALVFLGATIIIGILRFIFFTFYLEADKLIIKRGWLRKETKIIPIDKIQTVNIEQGPLHQVMNIVKLSIDTAGSQKTEATIDALTRPMAMALQAELLKSKEHQQEKEENVTPKKVLMQLSDKDLLKLSLSANHIETFFIIFAFGIGIFENITEFDEESLSGFESFLTTATFYPLLFLGVAILMITILVSTGRIFFTFYNFSIFHRINGFQVTSGITHLKERIIAFQKIQFLSIKANWIRKLMHLWMLEYYIAGGITVHKKTRVQIPVTRKKFIDPLLSAYYPLPNVEGLHSIRIHPLYIWRQLLIAGFIPALVLIIPGWLIWKSDALFIIFYPALIG